MTGEVINELCIIGFIVKELMMYMEMTLVEPSGAAVNIRCKYGRRRTRKGGRMMREEEALKKSICRRVLIYLCSQRQEIKRNKEIQPQITQGKKARA